MPKKKSIVPVEKIEQRILLIRGEKVIFDADLVEFYGVSILKPDPPPKKRRIGY